MHGDADVAGWVENALTQIHLATPPRRDAFRARLAALLNYEQVTAPVKRGGRYMEPELPLDKVIALDADMWSFTAHWTGLEVGQAEGDQIGF